MDEFKIDARKASSTGNVRIDKEEDKLIVYPSPAEDVLYINGVSEQYYTIIDLRSGMVVLRGLGNTANVSGLATGVYAVRVGNMTQSFVKK